MPSLSLTSNPPGAVCSGTNVVFIATPSGGGTAPTYSWTLNGSSVGANSSTYSNSSLNTGNNNIVCTMTSNAGCASPATATMSLAVTVNANVTPSIAITANPSGAICAGTNVTFSVSTTTNGGSSPSYQWFLNGAPVGSGTSYSYSGLTNGQTVYCQMTSNANCASPATVSSNTIIMSVNPLVIPTVTVSANPSVPVCTGSNIVFTAVPTNGGTAPTYSWTLNGSSVGSNIPTYSNSALPAGTNTVVCTITSNATCANPATATASIVVTVNSSVVPSVTVSSNPLGTICSGTNETFIASPTNGGTTPTYSWVLNGNIVGTNSATYANSSLPAGTNSIVCIVTSNATCASPVTATTSATVTVNPSISPLVVVTANPSGAICSGTNVTFTATPTNGGTAPTYSWTLNGSSVGSNIPTYSNPALPAGSNTILCSVTSNATCASPVTATSSVAVTVNPTVTPSVVVSANPSGIVCAGTSVTFTAIPTNGGATPTYSWTLNGSSVGSNIPTYSNPALPAGANTVVCTITSNATCASPVTATSSAVVTITTIAVPSLSLTSNPPGAVCSGTTVVFTATPSGGGTSPTYSWTLNGSIVGTNSSTYSSASLNTGNNIIVCTMTSNAGCASPVTATMSLAVSVNASVTPSIAITANPPSPVCIGTTVVFTAVPSGGGTSPAYQWSQNGLNSGSNARTFSSSTLISGNNIIVCTMTSNAVCASPIAATMSLPITVNTIPSITTQPVDTSVCQGQNAAFSTTAGSTTTMTYQWQVSTDGGVSWNNTPTTPPYFNYTTATLDIVPATIGMNNYQYRVVITNACGATNSNAGTLFVGSGPVNVIALASPNPVCVGTTLDLTGTATGATTWSWTGSGGFSSTAQNPQISPVTTSQGGIYTLTVTNSCGTVNVTTGAIVVSTGPTGISAGATPNPVCSGQSLSLTGTALGATYWSWAGPAGFTATIQNTSMPSISSIQAGIYTLYAGNRCDTVNSTVSVSLNYPPTGVNISVSSDTICSGQTLTFTGTAINASSFEWKDPNDLLISGAQVYPFYNISVSQSGMYHFNAINTCGVVSDSVDIIVHQTPAMPGPITGPLNPCIGSTACYSIPGIAGVTYQWSIPNGWTLVGTTGDSICTLPSTNQGQISVTVSNGYCMSTSQALTIQGVNLAVDAGPTIWIAAGTSAHITGQCSGINVSWLWSGGSISGQDNLPTVNTGSLSSDTWYYVSVDNGNGCSAIDSVLVRIIPTHITIIEISGLPDTICSGETIQLHSLVKGGDTLNYSILWSGSGVQNPSLQNTIAIPADTGVVSYKLHATDGVDSDDSTISVYVKQSPIAEGGPNIGIGCNIPFDTIGLAAVPGNTYLWAPAAGLNNANIAQPVASVVQPTTYTLTVTNVNGCVSTDTVLVAPIGSITANAGKDTAICNGAVARLHGTSDFGNVFIWTPFSDLNNPYIAEPLATPTAIGIYTLTVGYGSCSASDEVQIDINTINVSLVYDCQSFTAIALPDGLVSYEFSVNGVVKQDSSDNNSYFNTTINNKDSIQVFAIDENGCSVRVATINDCGSEWVNAFTPDGDGINDRFGSGRDMRIFDRWGLQLYIGSDGWDGTFNGKGVPAGTYYFIIQQPDPSGGFKEITGPVTLVRK